MAAMVLGGSVRRREVSLTILHLLLFVMVLAAIAVPANVAASPAAEKSTFTKWIVTSPDMEGIVGGAVGEGSFSGEILKFTPGTTTMIEALYHFAGSAHTFSALLHIEQTGLNAVLIGVVTDGWLKGHHVVGEYTQIATDQSPNGTAFRGTLEIAQ